ncbi:MAG: hypothetical protein QM708_13135 [Propioniciclava sp.]|uniref:hypothetical protein n=1 Tax=Propioniciclava sp. TaxID=2038686 RepID=UPI0039E53144
MRTELTFFLPVTRVRLSAAMIQLTDELEPGRNITEVAAWSAELVTVADTSQPRTIAVESGILRDYGLKLSLTDDGRLASASVESTGQVGTVLASAAGLATSVAAAVMFRLPMPLVAPSPPPVVTKGVSRAPADTGATRTVSAAEQRYAAEHPAEAKRLADLQDEHATVQSRLSETRRQYLAVDATGRSEAWTHYRRIVRLVADVAEELTRAKALFDAWRHSHQNRTDYVEAVTVEVSALPVVSVANNGGLTLTWTPDGAEVQQFFERTKHVLARVNEEEWPGPSADPGEPSTGAALRVRRPRLVGLATVHQDDKGELWMTGERRELIMDAACIEVNLPLRKSWLARRKTAVELSPLGALTGVELGGEATGAATARSIAGAGATAVAALESAQRTRTTLSGLVAAGEEDELARLRREAAIAEQRLLAAGLAATASDFARLEWLKQQVAIADAEAKLGDG